MSQLPGVEAPKGQGRVITEVRRLVDAWRGCPLGRAAEPYPEAPPRYQPVADGEQPLGETSLVLLHHWFRREPHLLLGRDDTRAFKYWPHQRRLVETFIYLYEVRRIRRTEELYELTGTDPLEPQRDPWVKLGGQLATGSGKTKMMSLLIAWSYLNAVCEGEEHLGLGRHSLLIAPGLFVKDRLLQDFKPEGRAPAIFLSDPVIPPELESSWHLQVYGPSDCPTKLDPADGALVVTNYHQLLRTRDDAPDLVYRSPEERQTELLFEDGEPQKLEAVSTPLVERFGRSRGIFVLNDEAHHVWDEPGHTRFEQRQREKLALGEEASTAMAWIAALRRLNGGREREGRLGLQVDLSATLYEEAGANKSDKGKVEFKQNDLFRHTAVYYALPEAITDGIVKRPILERVEVKNTKTGQIEPLVRQGQPDAWEKYRNILMTGIERWKKVREVMRAEGDPRKPLMFVLCADRKEAREVANYLTHGQAVQDDLSHLAPKGFHHPETGEVLFLDAGSGPARSTVVEIHIGSKEESNEEEWEKVRRAVNAIDHDRITDPTGALAEDGSPAMIDNPYNVVVSVMMLREGWDVRNVKVIVPLRPCGSRTLTEQVIGRGLRKMHAPELDEDGAAAVTEEELYVIEHESFKTILEEIEDLVEVKGSDEIIHTPERVPIRQRAELSERELYDVRLVRFEGLVEVVPDWRKHFEVRRLEGVRPRVSWIEELGDLEINTFLKKAFTSGESAGQSFTLSGEPSYRDFDHVIEHAYAIPLLKELKASYQHKNAVKGVVREFLEQKTFALPMGLPLSFDKVLEAGHARIALGNLARPEVILGVREALRPALNDALNVERAATRALLQERRAVEIDNYQAARKNVLDDPKKSTFAKAAMDSPEERVLATLLDDAKDVKGWLYNHRHGVGYRIEYDWQGYTAKYYPDFIARALIGKVCHNFIIEVKGRLDDRDKKKAERAVRYCELLTEYDKEPWHYLFLVENGGLHRADITWWSKQSTRAIADLWRRHESLPLIPEDRPTLFGPQGLEVLLTVPEADRFASALPVYDLAIAAGDFSGAQVPLPKGWVRLGPKRALDRRMFVAKVIGKSMEGTVADGSWALFRSFPVDGAPSSMALDGRRVVVQLRTDEVDPELGGRYTLKRWRVTRVSEEGGVEEIELAPDNRAFPKRLINAADGDIRPVAELVEVLA